MTMIQRHASSWLLISHIYCLQIFLFMRCINTLKPRQNGRHFADDTFKCIFLKENVRISIKISLKFVSKSPIDNIPALFQIMAWHRPGDKPLSEAMMVSLLTHICVARPQWVNNGDTTDFNDVISVSFSFISNVMLIYWSPVLFIFFI